jgi:hypothetical protein
METLAHTIILAAVVACIAWTVTKEEVFREWREICQKHKLCGSLLKRKFFYVWTCEYCFSHWVAFAAVLASGHRVGYSDWRGFIVAVFFLVAIANVFMTVYQMSRATLRWLQARANHAEADAKIAATTASLAK